MDVDVILDDVLEVVVGLVERPFATARRRSARPRPCRAAESPRAGLRRRSWPVGQWPLAQPGASASWIMAAHLLDVVGVAVEHFQTGSACLHSGSSRDIW